jgi:hypothetical protein
LKHILINDKSSTPGLSRHLIFQKKEKFNNAMSHISEKIVPAQQAGGRKDFEFFIVFRKENEAKNHFSLARKRLLNIHSWKRVSKGMSASFVLTDASGNAIHSPAKKGDYLKIDIPGPGLAEGNGYDWAVVESVEDTFDEVQAYQRTAMRVRPANNPKDKGENVAHFFTDAATSTFVVERKGNEVIAAIHGRNEIPNIQADTAVDKVRNAVVAASAIMGFSNIQWRNLAKGLIS